MLIRIRVKGYYIKIEWVVFLVEILRGYKRKS